MGLCWRSESATASHVHRRQPKPRFLEPLWGWMILGFLTCTRWMKYYHYLNVHVSQCTRSGILQNWNTTDSFCNYSFPRFLLFFAQIFFFTQDVKFPGFESQALDITVAMLIWKAIEFQWGSVRSPIYKQSLIIFAVIILTDKQYWYYEEVT